jgi:putative oxidoreductase
MKYFLLLGRILFSLIFVSSGLFHFSEEAVIQASLRSVPMPEILVPVAGIMAILGGLSIAFGYKAKVGALLLVVFLIPVTLFMHNFWSVESSIPVQVQLAAFMKNIALTGTALFISYFGSGSISIDSLLKKRLLKRKVAVV